VKSIRVSDTVGEKRDDTLLYKYRATDKTYDFFKIRHDLGKGMVSVSKIHTARLSDKGATGLKWHRTGAFRFNFASAIKTLMHLSSFSGKAIKVSVPSKDSEFPKIWIFSIPDPVLREN
jgi:hypothetical protein